MSGDGKRGGKDRAPARRTEQRRAIGDQREAVLLALLSYEKNDTFSNVLVKRTLDGCAHMTAQERAFIKRLLEGVIERKTELDARIGDLTGRPVRKLHPVVLQILRMGIYQILYMDAVPDSAACNESVRLARRHAPARLSGFVNGVLRNAARQEDERRQTAGGDMTAGQKSAGQKSAQQKSAGLESVLQIAAGPAGAGKAGTGMPASVDGAGKEEAGEPADRVRTLELRYSVPQWLIRMWTDQLGEEETDRLLESLTQILPVSARFCHGPGEEERKRILADLVRAGAEVEKGRWLADSFRLRRTSDLRKLPGFARGLWTVQDESSMLAVEAAGLTGTETVYDICAAPGGKSFLAADLLRAKAGRDGRDLSEAGRVYSFDLTRKKTARIREGAERLGLPNVIAAERDARVFYPESEGTADILLCDLPCSGLGVIGKKRDIKYHASPEGIRDLQDLQRQILTCAVRYLKPGGVMIYSTCTISRLENDDNADWIESELGLVPEDLADFLPAGLPGIRGGRLQLLPHIHGTDGFFIARFRKKS